ncbi:hypothetical protein V5N11_010537 [Cardamine amara subsp. amara]|uniref:RNase H type-1 domain-containing protein n=1 Tax=Cardamine amara subsp. amara TaxID=228776 RepID=A0ABD1B4G9_CARAN
MAEFRCIHKTVQSLRNIQVIFVEIKSSCKAAMDAILINPVKDWPRYINYLDLLTRISASFNQVTIKLVPKEANLVAWDIAPSVTGEGQFQSNLALEGTSRNEKLY